MEFLSLKKLKLPKDVIENSGSSVNLVGKLTGAEDEIIVLTQFCRTVGTAYVCHLSDGYDSENCDIPCKVISDIPDFPKMIIKDVSIKNINGVRYTMACLADKDFAEAVANWLY